MARLLARRLLFMVTVYVPIVYAVHTGLRMSQNSEAAQPDYDLRERARYAL